MTNIESDIAEINISSQKVFNFLSNLNNLEKLMPEQVINWKSTENTCSFTIKGMIDLSMKISEKIPNSKIIIIPGDNPPFDFSLVITFQELKENFTNTRIAFNAELSMMIEMMAKTPLQNFVNLLVTKLKELGDKL